MSEEFLYYIWKHRLYQPELYTTSGEPLVIEHPGFRNEHAGPDFSDARLRIGDTLWAGNLEIHVQASDWFKHHHHEDEAYQKIILHVVYEADTEIRNNKGESIPCLELKSNFSELYSARWKRLLKSRKWIACEDQLRQVPENVISNWLDRLLVERFESKTEAIDAYLEATGNDWEASFFRALCRSFGFHVNAGPMEILARSFDYKLLLKYQHDPLLLEALLFGQAGLLNDKLDDAYNLELVKEYEYLQHKHNLQAMPGLNWRFMRMRPVNFPSIRIAQLAALYHVQKHLFASVIECHNLDALAELFNVAASAYWDDHYIFGKKAPKKEKRLGRSSFDIVLVNTIAPLLFVYGRRQLQEVLTERALDYLYSSQAESNAIVRNWSKSGIKATHAGHSQALLHLKKHYCAYTRCLHCQIGNELITNT